MAKSIRAGKVPRHEGKIQSPPPRSGEIVFSFRYLDAHKTGYSPSDCPAEWFCDLFERLRDLSTMKAAYIRNSTSEALRAHRIDWSRTTEPDGFTHLNEQLRDVDGYQFQIAKTKGRVHGQFIDDTFYVIWLDPEHRLYAR